jgi:thiol-disulfide isomerase/thioredoxin
MKRRHTLALGAAGLAAAAGGVVWSLRRNGAPALDEAEAELWGMSFDQPGGGQLHLQSLRGRPVLLNFWATWCAPCVKEMPLLDRFHRDRQAAGWSVVGIAVDSAAPVTEFLGRVPVSFPIGLAGMAGAELSRRLGNTQSALPFTVVFDRHGKAVARRLGTVTQAMLDDWARQVEAA